MSQTLIGRKIGMTQIYTQDGKCIPVTLVESGPCVVTQIKRETTDGYNALQIGLGSYKRKSFTRPMLGHQIPKTPGQNPEARKKHLTDEAKSFRSVRIIREIPWDGQGEVQPGQQITCKVFEGVKFVDVTGTSKGRGMAGVVKRYRFRGGPATHGQSDRERAPGSIAGGNSDPSRVWKGKKMPGHMGAVRRTVRNLELVRIDADKSLLLIQGAVPGPNGGWLIVRKSKTKTAKAT